MENAAKRRAFRRRDDGSSEDEPSGDRPAREGAAPATGRPKPSKPIAVKSWQLDDSDGETSAPTVGQRSAAVDNKPRARPVVVASQMSDETADGSHEQSYSRPKLKMSSGASLSTTAGVPTANAGGYYASNSYDAKALQQLRASQAATRPPAPAATIVVDDNDDEGMTEEEKRRVQYARQQRRGETKSGERKGIAFSDVKGTPADANAGYIQSRALPSSLKAAATKLQATILEDHSFHLSSPLPSPPSPSPHAHTTYTYSFTPALTGITVAAPPPELPSDEPAIAISKLLTQISIAAESHRNEERHTEHKAAEERKGVTKAGEEAMEYREKLATAMHTFDAYSKIREFVATYIDCARAKQPLVNELWEVTATAAAGIEERRWQRRRTEGKEALMESEKRLDSTILGLCSLPEGANRVRTGVYGPGGTPWGDSVDAAAENTRVEGKRRVFETFSALQNACLQGSISAPLPSIHSFGCENDFIEPVGVKLSRARDAIYEDTGGEYREVNNLLAHMEQWKADPRRAVAYAESFAFLSLVDVITPAVSTDVWLWAWETAAGRTFAPIESHAWFSTLWHFSEQAITRTGTASESVVQANNEDSNIIPRIVERVLIPHLCSLIPSLYDAINAAATQQLIHVLQEQVLLFDPSPDARILLHNAVLKALHSAAASIHIPAAVIHTQGVDTLSNDTLYHVQLCLELCANIIAWGAVIPMGTLAELFFGTCVHTLLRPVLQWLVAAAGRDATHTYAVCLLQSLLQCVDASSFVTAEVLSLDAHEGRQLWHMCTTTGTTLK
jgi:hypothetical protein